MGRPGTFAPGESGNPNGRPKKGESLTAILREYGNLIKEAENGDRKPMKELLAAKLFELALKGDITAIKYVYDRLEGTPKQTTEVTGNMDYVIIPPERPDREE